MPERTGGQKDEFTHTHTARTQGSQGQGCESSSSPTCDLSASCGVGSNKSPWDPSSRALGLDRSSAWEAIKSHSYLLRAQEPI